MQSAWRRRGGLRNQGTRLADGAMRVQKDRCDVSGGYLQGRVSMNHCFLATDFVVGRRPPPEVKLFRALHGRCAATPEQDAVLHLLKPPVGVAVDRHQ